MSNVNSLSLATAAVLYGNNPTVEGLHHLERCAMKYAANRLLAIVLLEGGFAREDVPPPCSCKKPLPFAEATDVCSNCGRLIG